MIRRNVNVSLRHGILMCNGSWCVLADVVLAAHATPVWDAQEGCHRITAVRALVFRYEMAGWSGRRAFSDLPPGCFVLVPEEFRVSFHFHHGRQVVSVKACQFPVVQARCITGHKAQGTTVPGAIILGFVAALRRAGFTSWTCVSLSRVRDDPHLANRCHPASAQYRYRLNLARWLNASCVDFACCITNADFACCEP